MATSYSKHVLPSRITVNHPFKININKIGKTSNNGPQYELSLNSKSKLIKNLVECNANYLCNSDVSIENLKESKKVPSSFPGKNFYCVLKVKIKYDNTERTLEADGAEITWVEDDKSVEELNPVVFESGTLKQKEARIIIGVLVNDREEFSGTTDGEDEIKTDYIIQFISTHLIMTPMVFEGAVILYPLPYNGFIGEFQTNDPDEPTSSSSTAESAQMLLNILEILTPLGDNNLINN